MNSSFGKKTVQVLLKNGSRKAITFKEVKQDILPQYSFVVHKSIDIDKCYVITETITGCSAYTHIGKRKDCIEIFLTLLEENKDLYIEAIEKMRVKHANTHQTTLF